MSIDNRPAIERFTGKTIRLNDGCIEWTAYRNANGYGRFKPGKGMSMKLAHRWAYEFHVGPIPDGLVIDHLCRNRSCVNPDHLEAVTQKVNIRRGHGNGSKSHCPQGHPYSCSNLRRYRGFRYCLACQEQKNRARVYRRRV